MKMGKLLPVFAAVFATGCGCGSVSVSVSGSSSGSAYASETAPPCAYASAVALCLPRLPSSTSRRLKLDLNGFQAVK